MPRHKNESSGDGEITSQSWKEYKSISDIESDDQPRPSSDHSWMEDANCKNKTEKMFPKEHKDITYIVEARALCADCSVREKCLEYALEFPPTDMHGVWAGLTGRQLAAEQRRRGLKPIRPTLAQMWG